MIPRKKHRGDLECDKKAVYASLIDCECQTAFAARPALKSDVTHSLFILFHVVGPRLDGAWEGLWRKLIMY